MSLLEARCYVECLDCEARRVRRYKPGPAVRLCADCDTGRAVWWQAGTPAPEVVRAARRAHHVPRKIDVPSAAELRERDRRKLKKPRYAQGH